MSDRKDKPALRSTIEENLRKVYREMLDEEVPDRFRQLLAELKRTQGAKADGDGDGGEGAK